MSKYTQLITEFQKSGTTMVDFCFNHDINFNAFRQAIFRENKKNNTSPGSVTSNVTSNGNTSPGEESPGDYKLGMRHMIKNEKISLDEFLDILKTNPSLALRIENRRSLGEITLIYYVLRENQVL